MFGYITKNARLLALKSQNSQQEKLNKTILTNDINANLKLIKDILVNSSDMVIREFKFSFDENVNGALVYINGLTDKDTIHRDIMRPLMSVPNTHAVKSSIDMDYITNNLLTVSNFSKVLTVGELINHILSGTTILLVDGLEEALAIFVKKWEGRSVDEPQTESVIRGPREGFTENIKVNTALIRRKIKSSDLCIEKLVVGVHTKTDVNIVYLKSIADAKILEEVKKRIKNIQTDAILESGYIEQFIEDRPFSVFPTIANSEKPDKVAAKILEGRIAVLADGSPFALTVPMLFVESFQASDDYYSRTIYASFLRMIRYLAYTASVLAPAAYVALTVFHQELIPTQLLISIAAGREPIPFPAVIEAALMLITFDILREAGVRLPKPVGPAVSIVGALVLGQSAVQAGLISPIMVIVVAATAISSFVVPAQTGSGVLLRYIYLFFAGFAGGFGILMGILLTMVYMASVESFGVQYFEPIAPLSISDLKDTAIRAPIWMQAVNLKSMIIPRKKLN